MSTAWPPPPDLDSLKELFATADVEGLIAVHEAPGDEYDGEAEALHAAIQSFPTARITVAELTPLLDTIFSRSFNLDCDRRAERRPALLALATQIARFFGPEAQPQVRTR